MGGSGSVGTVSAVKDEKIPEMGSNDGCTTGSVLNAIELYTYTVKMVNFMSCIFYHK